jgi:hypothetical protein
VFNEIPNAHNSVCISLKNCLTLGGIKVSSFELFVVLLVVRVWGTALISSNPLLKTILTFFAPQRTLI